MNGAVRTKLRTELAALLAAEFPIGEVKAGRYYDAREAKPFVLVYFAEGVADSESMAGLTQAQLIVEINLPEGGNQLYTDDDLDTWGDQLKAVFDADQDLTLDAEIAGIRYEGFDYPPPEDRPYLSLNLNFTLYSR